MNAIQLRYLQLKERKLLTLALDNKNPAGLATRNWDLRSRGKKLKRSYRKYTQIKRVNTTGVDRCGQTQTVNVYIIIYY